MLDVFLDALIDTSKILPVLFIVYLLIELIERSATSKVKYNEILQGKFAPLIATFFGVIPQCGFSVIAANLYSEKTIGLGTLLAIFIATSDEAIPIMLADPTCYDKLWKIIVFKIVFALVVGYAVYLIEKFTKKNKLPLDKNIEPNKVCPEKIVKHKSKWDIFVHPLLHSLKICLYIFIVNFVLNTCIFYIGKESMTAFLTANIYLEPFVTCLVGLIPNCAASVILIELYLIGGLHFGGIIAGLSVNAGIGMAILLKQNKPMINNIYILLGLYILCSVVGLIVNLIVV